MSTERLLTRNGNGRPNDRNGGALRASPRLGLPWLYVEYRFPAKSRFSLQIEKAHLSSLEFCDNAALGLGASEKLILGGTFNARAGFRD